MNLTGQQIKTILAAYLGWTLDAFDFFVLTFVIKDIAKEFGVEVSEVAYALFLTLAMRFVGAFIFGRIGDKWGRKPALMLDILAYSIIGAVAAFSPNLTVFLVLRALFGIAMGGEWGLGSSLAMESIPPQARGTVSGILQCGYPSGFLLAAVAYGLLYGQTFGGVTVGWRAMFLLSVLPAFVVLFIRAAVPKSPAFEASKAHEKPHLWATVAQHKGLVIYMVVLMMCFNLFSHGTQDLYPTFLQKQHGFDPGDGELDQHCRQLGAIAGGLTFGHISEKIGRVNAITIASVIALPTLPLWAYSVDARAARARRLHHAGRGAGRLGRGPGPSQRTVAERGARHHPGLRLPGRQLPRLLQRAVPGQDRRGQRRELRLCAGAGGHRGGDRDGHHHPLQPRTPRRAFDGALRGAVSGRPGAGSVSGSIPSSSVSAQRWPTPPAAIIPDFLTGHDANVICHQMEPNIPIACVLTGASYRPPVQGDIYV